LNKNRHFFVVEYFIIAAAAIDGGVSGGGSRILLGRFVSRWRSMETKLSLDIDP
jgi:hypothetical protein